MDERHRVMRQRYREAFAEVRLVTNDADPEFLREMGAPVDEYDPEVGDLVRLVLRPDPPTEDEVNAVWRRWFDSALAPTIVAGVTGELRVLHARYAHA
jgi:hypothetical protein